jgi:hypothetical protein
MFCAVALHSGAGVDFVFVGEMSAVGRTPIARKGPKAGAQHCVRNHRRHPSASMGRLSIMDETITMASKAADNQDDAALRRAYVSSEWRIIPILSCLWLLAWLDRSNVAFAKL